MICDRCESAEATDEIPDLSYHHERDSRYFQVCGACAMAFDDLYFDSNGLATDDEFGEWMFPE